jgi:hypothetical protein
MASERTNQSLPEKSADTPPDSTHPYGPCSRCGRNSSFTVIGNAPLTYNSWRSQNRDGSETRDWDEQVSVLQCQGCNQNTMVVEEQYVGGRRKRDALHGGGALQWVGTFWWPVPGSATTEDVPAPVADAISEGRRCLLVQSPRAAAVMFRGALGQIVNDLGSDDAKRKDTLAAQLKQMAADGVLNASLSEWAAAVRVLGNAGAHPNELEPVPLSEAEDLSRLIGSIVEFLYVVPARVQRQREKRT